MKRRLSCEWTAENLIAGNSHVYLWTFTTVREETPEAMAEMWDHLLKRLRRKFGCFDYFRVLEPHKSGTRFHYHVLVNVFLDVRTVRDIAEPLGWGRMNVKLVRDKGAAGYLAKYLSKAKRCEALQGVRLFSVSIRPRTFTKVRIQDIEYRENGKTMAELYGCGMARFPKFQRYSELQLRRRLATSTDLPLRDWLRAQELALREAGYDVESEYVGDLVENPNGRLVYVKTPVL